MPHRKLGLLARNLAFGEAPARPLVEAAHEQRLVHGLAQDDGAAHRHAPFVLVERIEELLPVILHTGEGIPSNPAERCKQGEDLLILLC